MRKSKVVVLAAIVVATTSTGCSMSTATAVISVSEVTGETFVGLATSGSGGIEVSNGSGVSCTGKYNSQSVWTATEGIAREGVMNCSDGRTGTFNVAGTALGGQGVGELGDDPITLYYGRSVGIYRASPQSRRHGAKKKSKGGTGSGFVVNRMGHVVTNQHVVEGCSSVFVSSKTGKAEAEVIASDKRNDVAVVLPNQQVGVPLNFRVNTQVKLAEDIVALGFPLQSILAKQLHATSGDVTALAGIGSDTRYIQISAPIQFGNSGGPIVDQFGNVVAMATSKLNTIAIAGATGDVPQNVNFGLKSTVITNFFDVHGIAYSRDEEVNRKNKTDMVSSVKGSVVFIECRIK